MIEHLHTVPYIITVPTNWTFIFNKKKLNQSVYFYTSMWCVLIPSVKPGTQYIAPENPANVFKTSRMVIYQIADKQKTMKVHVLIRWLGFAYKIRKYKIQVSLLTGTRQISANIQRL